MRPVVSCPTWFDRAAPQPVCPACNKEPQAIERRPVAHGELPTERETRAVRSTG